MLPSRPAPLAVILSGSLLGISLALGAAVPPAPGPRPDLVVAADGSGNYSTIQDALNSIPRRNRERRVILVKNGLYLQKVRIDADAITLRGESRAGTRIVFAQPAEAYRRHPDGIGIGVVNIHGDDCVLEHLTIENTYGVVGVHAYAVAGDADRTVITDCDVLSLGNDTLSLQRPEGGRYYLARLRISGSIDFVAPRGWCYLADSDLDEVDPRAAALWHDGSDNPAMKFVIRRCRFFGPRGWQLARHHHDALFLLLDCTFAATMRNLAPHRVLYPLDGAPPSQEDIDRNMELNAANKWGERDYYFDCHRRSGDYPWFRDNLVSAPGAPTPAQVTAAWTFGGTWDPERTAGPTIRRIDRRGDRISVVFSEPVTVKGKPRLRLRSGSAAGYVAGSGSATLVFDAPADARDPVARVDLDGGAIIATEATVNLRPADLRVP